VVRERNIEAAMKERAIRTDIAEYGPPVRND